MTGGLRYVFFSSLVKSVRASWSIIAIMVPVSLGVTLLQYTGLLERLARLFTPVMALVALPPEASFALLAAALINIYAGIAVMGTLGVSAWDLNIIAVMMLTCHNLIVESAVQSKTGVSGLKMTLFRIVAAVGMGFLLSRLLPESLKLAGTLLGAAPEQAQQTLPQVLALWTRQTGQLTLKIVVIIAAINLVIDLMRHYKAFDPVIALLRPLTALHGLPGKVAFMWMAGVLFGLAYGSGVLIAEARTGRIDKDALLRLNLSLGISHSLIEDTLLFLAIGASLFWVLVPRMLVAAAMVWLHVLATRWGRAASRGITPGT